MHEALVAGNRRLVSSTRVAVRRRFEAASCHHNIEWLNGLSGGRDRMERRSIILARGISIDRGLAASSRSRLILS